MAAADRSLRSGFFRLFSGIVAILGLTGLLAGCGGSSSDTTSAVRNAESFKLQAIITTPYNGIQVREDVALDFNATAVGGSGTYAYAWTFPGGSPANSGSQNQAGVTFEKNGTYTVSLTITDSNGNTASASVTVTITDTPESTPTALTAVITAPANGLSANAGDAVAFSAAAYGGSETYSYAWYFPGGSPANSTSQTQNDVIFAAGGNYNVSLTVTDSDGNVATDTVTVKIAAAPAVVTPTLTAVITAPAGGITIVAGDAVDFAAIATGGSGTYSYSWDFTLGGNPVNSTSQTVDDVLFNVGGFIYTVTLTVTDSSGNTDTDTVTVNVL